MVMHTSEDFTFERKAAIDRNNPTVMEWEKQMSRYQQADEGADAGSKWRRMQPVFEFDSDGVVSR